MSDLTRQQLKYIQGALDVQEIKSKARLQFQKDDVEHHLGVSSTLDEEGDEIDHVTAKNFIEVNHSITQHIIHELESIDAARKRMQQVHYGKCIDCDQSIGYQRLIACPTTQRCIRCQNIHERTYQTKPFSSSRLSA
jgi:DnaK suppressor protein